MCPSYMATREEEHATRGRANALVKALSEPDPRAALGDERLHEILDLCLECKACKSECPLSVDMATMKAEFLSHYQAQHGDPAALAAVRRDPAPQPARRRDRAAEQPPGAARAARARRRHRPPRGRSRASTRDTLLRWDRGALAAARRARRRRLPCRLVHHLHRARDRPRRDRAAGGRRAGTSGWRARAAAGARASPRGCSARRAGWPRRWWSGSRPRPSAASRSSAASRRAC